MSTRSRPSGKSRPPKRITRLPLAERRRQRQQALAEAALANKPANWAERYPINAAIREIMVSHGLSYAETAKLVYVSEQTLYAWNRTRPPRAPKTALALLCCVLKLPPHPALTGD